jgi:putative transcriptional regulator
MKKAFDKIAAGLEDAIAWSSGDEGRGREVRLVDVKAAGASRTG